MRQTEPSAWAAYTENDTLWALFKDEAAARQYVYLANATLTMVQLTVVPLYRHEQHVEPCDYYHEVQRVSGLLVDADPNHSHTSVADHLADLLHRFPLYGLAARVPEKNGGETP